VLAVLAYVFGWASECCVEGESLWFTSENMPPISVAIEDVIAIDQIEGGEHRHFEITVRNKGRMKVKYEIFQPIKPLRKALLTINRDIQFGTQSASHCRECGTKLFSPDDLSSIPQTLRALRRERCPECNHPFPKFGKFV